jgi:hypothetical protein
VRSHDPLSSQFVFTSNTSVLARELRPELARVMMARKIAAITLAVWKAEVGFEAGKLLAQAA